MINSWDFVEEYYPNYSNCNEIAKIDDLMKLTEYEYQKDSSDSAYQRLLQDYSGDIEDCQIQLDLTASLLEAFEIAILNFMEQKTVKTQEINTALK